MLPFKIVLQLLSGFGAGAVGGGISYLLFEMTYSLWVNAGFDSELNVFVTVVSLPVGFGVGAPLGIYGVGRAWKLNG